MSYSHEYHVPQEIREHIINFLDNDIRSLARCVQVCKSLLPFSQKLLFKGVTLEPPKRESEGDQLNPPPRIVDHFYSTLLSKPFLAEFIQELTVYHWRPDCTRNILDLRLGPWTPDPQEDSLIQIIALLKNLRRLEVVGMEVESCWEMLSLPCRMMAEPMPLYCASDRLKQPTVSTSEVSFASLLISSMLNLRELVLEEVSFSLPLKKRKPKQPIYLETLVINGFIASVNHLTRYITRDKTCNLDFSRLKPFRYADSNQIAQEYVLVAWLVIHKCQSSLESFDFWSAQLISDIITQDDLSYPVLANVRNLGISTQWQVNQGFCDIIPLQWLGRRFQELSKLDNHLQSFVLRCSFCWYHYDQRLYVEEKDAIDWDVDHSGWEELDRILGSSSAFPELERVEIKLLLHLEEFTNEIRSRMPQLLERGMLHITGEPAVAGESSHSFMFIERDSARMLKSMSTWKIPMQRRDGSALKRYDL